MSVLVKGKREGLERTQRDRLSPTDYARRFSMGAALAPPEVQMLEMFGCFSEKDCGAIYLASSTKQCELLSRRL